MKFLTSTSILICILFFIDLTSNQEINGGKKCAHCTIITGMIQQKLLTVPTNNGTWVDMAYENFCQQLDDENLANVCIIVGTLASWIYGNQDLVQFVSPDLICYVLGACTVDLDQRHCHLFPESKLFLEIPRIKIDFCGIPILSDICDFFNKSQSPSLTPFFDKDEDSFSFVDDIRGAYWRGRDCNDFNSLVYPGAQSLDNDIDIDYNCNGIYGEDEETERPWEEILCNDTTQYGLIYIGDDMGVNFQMPQSWYDPKMETHEGIGSISLMIVNGPYWPELGFFNGFVNSYDILRPDVVQTEPDSLYLRFREHDLCNHHDYQNLAFLGAKAEDTIKQAQSINRNTFDKPAIVFYLLAYNDVCNDYTKPADFELAVTTFLENLESKLAPNSHVVLFSLYNGDMIIPSTAEILYPLGELNKDVRGKNVHKWYNCLGINVCKGWTTRNETITSITTKRAEELSLVLKNISEHVNYNNFAIHYKDNPVNRAFNEWKESGKEPGMFFNNYNFVYPSQYAQSAIAKSMWDILMELNIIGPPNKNNDKIKELFGNNFKY